MTQRKRSDDQNCTPFGSVHQCRQGRNKIMRIGVSPLYSYYLIIPMSSRQDIQIDLNDIICISVKGRQINIQKAIENIFITLFPIF